MFEKASRLQLRFHHRGLCSVEDLWVLPLEDLDHIFKALNAERKAQTEESLLDVRSPEDEITDLRIAIVKHIVKVRLEEQKAREELAERAAEKRKTIGYYRTEAGHGIGG